MKSKNKFEFFSLLIILLIGFNFSNATTLKETFKKQLSCDGRPTLEVKNSNDKILKNTHFLRLSLLQSNDPTKHQCT